MGFHCLSVGTSRKWNENSNLVPAILCAQKWHMELHSCSKWKQTCDYEPFEQTNLEPGLDLDTEIQVKCENVLNLSSNKVWIPFHVVVPSCPQPVPSKISFSWVDHQHSKITSLTFVVALDAFSYCDYLVSKWNLASRACLINKTKQNNTWQRICSDMDVEEK